MKTSKNDQHYIMNTAMLEVSIQENISMNDLAIRVSVKEFDTYLVVQLSNKKIWFKKTFK